MHAAAMMANVFRLLNSAMNTFKTNQAHEIIEYVRKNYNRELEFLWVRSPGNAVWRRGDNEKWFGVLLTVAGNKIIPDAGDDTVEILDVRCAPDVTDFIVDKKKIFPGYHMNKRHWVTIVLDGCMATRDICRLLSASYEIAGQK